MPRASQHQKPIPPGRLIEIPGLSKHGIYIYSGTLRCLPICISCGRAIRPPEIMGHFTDKTQGHHVTGSAKKELKKEVKAMKKEIRAHGLELLQQDEKVEDWILPRGQIPPFSFLELYPTPEETRVGKYAWHCRYCNWGA